MKHGTPAPWDCDLFYVDRAALLSGHRLTDNLLHHILHVYGASDLARDGDVLASLASPNDHIMLLLGPQAEAQGQASGLPDILSVIHVRSGPAGQLGGEGEGLLTMGQRPLSGIEIVRVATHPEVRRMGYGLRAVHMALRYFRGDLIATMEQPQEAAEEEAPQEVGTHHLQLFFSFEKRCQVQVERQSSSRHVERSPPFCSLSSPLSPSPLLSPLLRCPVSPSPAAPCLPSSRP